MSLQALLRRSQPPATDGRGAGAGPLADLLDAYAQHASGRLEQATALVAQIFSRHPAVEVLAAAVGHTQEVLDASDVSGSRWQDVDEDAVIKHLLYDKARDLSQWCAFLWEAGVWTQPQMQGVAGAATARQGVVEACERVAAAVRLRELHEADTAGVLAAAVGRAMREEVVGGTAAGAGSEALRYYGRVSACERVLSALAEYPRSLPLGSADVTSAVMYANGVAISFLEAALDRRERALESHPGLLPPLPPGVTPQRLEGSARPPRGLGSDWLLSPRILRALEDLQLASLEALPCAQAGWAQGFALLCAQALRVVDSLAVLCQTSLKAAHATLGDLHAPAMAQLRRPTLRRLAQAEDKVRVEGGTRAARGGERVLQLAREFEDFEAVVGSLASTPERLDELMAESEPFRAHALEHLLRDQSLQPLFFRAIARFEVPDQIVEKLLAPYPELRWTLELRGLDGASPDAAWLGALGRVERKVAKTAQLEVHTAAKRDAFVALATMARAAATRDTPQEPALAEMACLGRLRRLRQRFAGEGPGEGLRPGPRRRLCPNGPPDSVEECVAGLAPCLGRALRALRSEGSEGQAVADCACLARLAEPLAELGGESLAGDLQRLWAEAAIADAGMWQEALMAPEGPQRDALLASTCFFRMLTWKGPVARAACREPPPSAELGALCGTLEELRPLAPALRLAEALAASHRTE